MFICRYTNELNGMKYNVSDLWIIFFRRRLSIFHDRKECVETYVAKKPIFNSSTLDTIMVFNVMCQNLL